MTLDEWKELLKTYTTPKRTVNEVLEGIEDHLEGTGACRKDMKVTEYVRNRYSGIGPVETQARCTRGTPGCNLNHNDTEALVFAMIGLQKLKDLIDRRR